LDISYILFANHLNPRRDTSGSYTKAYDDEGEEDDSFHPVSHHVKNSVFEIASMANELAVTEFAACGFNIPDYQLGLLLRTSAVDIIPDSGKDLLPTSFIACGEIIRACEKWQKLLQDSI
jgi:hypothetical protein